MIDYDSKYLLNCQSFVVLLFGLTRNVVSLPFFFGNEVLGILIGLLEAILKSLPLLGSLGLGLSSSLVSLGLEGSSSLGGSVLLLLGNELSLLLGEWVELVHHGLVLQWVLLGLIMGSDVLSHVSQLGLNLIGVDDSSDISAGHNGSVQGEARLLGGSFVVSSKNGRESLEGILGVDHESTEMSSWGELEDVESRDVASINTWEISSGLLDVSGVITVDEKWTLSHDVSRVSIFSSSLSDLLGLSDLSKISSSTELGEGGQERLGVGVLGLENERELWDGVDFVTSGHDERGASGSSKSRGNGMSSLSDIASLVPFSPDLERSEHSSLSAHVTESGLTSSGSSTTRDSRDSCDSSTGSP